MEQYSSFHNYNDTNLVDGSPQHPNKYELIEKRNEYINEAIIAVMENQKEDVLKRPAVGLIDLVTRELRKKSNYDTQDPRQQENFRKEFEQGDIRSQICRHFGVADADFNSLEEKINSYYSK